MPNVVLLGYDPNQPSFRHRMQALVATLEAAGWQVRPERFPKGRYGLRTWERRESFRWAHVVVLHQIKLSGIEARLVGALSRRRVFDVDDAIYVRKPRRLGEPADDSVWRRRKFAATCRSVDVVAAGNEVLASVARAAAREVGHSADLDRYLLLCGSQRRRGCCSHHRVDRQSRESDLSGDDPPGAGAAQRAPPRAQSQSDLLGVPGLAGDPGGAGAVERGHGGRPRWPRPTSA